MKACPKRGEKYLKNGFLFRVDDVSGKNGAIEVYVVRWPIESIVTIGTPMRVDVDVWQREMFDAVRVVEHS